jgi:glycosyltransferase involved in cell wall biosynthesis
MKFRFHVLGLAHTRTTEEFMPCAFTQKVWKFCRMMTERGHTVIHYGAEGSNPICTEHVQVISTAEQKEFFGDYDWRSECFRPDNVAAQELFNKRAITEICKRKAPGDFLCITAGLRQEPIAKALDLIAVETGIGYAATFAKARVFESYAWMHTMYGADATRTGDNPASSHDAVIPNYYYPDDFVFSEKKDNYFLFVGRLIFNKGVHIAAKIAEITKTKLIVAGQGKLWDAGVMSSPYVEHIGTVDKEQRAVLMARAKAVIMPTQYVEPFGGVNVEAQMSGTPVITSDWGAFPETVVHGVTGYRCRTLEHYLWAARNIDKINPCACRYWAQANFSVEKVAPMYEEYFQMLNDLRGDGWWTRRENRTELEWLTKAYPVVR